MTAPTQTPAHSPGAGTAPAAGRPTTPAAGDHTKVIGLDLSLTSTGVAGAVGDSAWAETITTGKTRGHNRLATILSAVRCYTHGAALVVIEGLAFAAHDRNREQAGLHWLVRHQLWRDGTPYALVPPTTRMRYATGKGNAKKDHVLAAVIKRYSHLADVDGNDQADALVLAAMGAAWLGRPLIQLPATHVAALGSVTWPDPLGGAA